MGVWVKNEEEGDADQVVSQSACDEGLCLSVKKGVRNSAKN